MVKHLISFDVQEPDSKEILPDPETPAPPMSGPEPVQAGAVKQPVEATEPQSPEDSPASFGPEAASDSTGCPTPDLLESLAVPEESPEASAAVLTVPAPAETCDEGEPVPDSSLPDADTLKRAVRRVNYSHLRPVGLMRVPVSFSDHPDDPVWPALVDSGGDVNLIRGDVVTGLSLRIVPCGGTLKGFGIKEGSVLGTVTLSPIVHGRQFKPTKFMVVPEGGLTETVVLGSEFLVANKILIDNARNCISTVDSADGSRWDFYISDEGSCRQMYYGLKVCAAESVKLKPGEPVLVPVSVRYPEGHLGRPCPSCTEKDRSLYFYDSREIKDGLGSKVSGISGLMSEDGRSILVTPETSAWIRAGDVLGKMYSVLVVDQDGEESAPSSPNTPDEEVVQTVAKISLATDLTPDQQAQFKNMILRHSPVISRGDEDVGECASTPIQIHLYDETPIYQRPRRFSPPITEAIERQCQELHSLDIIEPSISLCSSPVVPVLKPDKSIRLCVDYRKLNKVTIPDRFPMVNLSDAVFGLHGVKYLLVWISFGDITSFPCMRTVKSALPFQLLMDTGSSRGCPLAYRMLLLCSRERCSEFSRNSLSARSSSILMTFLSLASRSKST